MEGLHHNLAMECGSHKLLSTSFVPSLYRCREDTQLVILQGIFFNEASTMTFREEQVSDLETDSKKTMRDWTLHEQTILENNLHY